MSDVNIPALIAVAVPTVPYGPDGVAARERDAKYYRDAAKNIRYQAGRGNAFSGSNLTETVAKLCDATAAALESVTVPTASDRAAAIDALAYSVCQKGGHIPNRDRALPGSCDFHRRTAAGYSDIVLAGFRLPAPVEPEWEYGVAGPTGRMVNNGDYMVQQTHRRTKAGPWVAVSPVSGGTEVVPEMFPGTLAALDRLTTTGQEGTTRSEPVGVSLSSLAPVLPEGREHGPSNDQPQDQDAERDERKQKYPVERERGSDVVSEHGSTVAVAALDTSESGG